MKKKILMMISYGFLFICLVNSASLGIAVVNNQVINIYDDYTWDYADGKQKYSSYYGSYSFTADSIRDYKNEILRNSSEEDAAVMVLAMPFLDGVLSSMKIDVTINENGTIDVLIDASFVTAEPQTLKGVPFVEVNSHEILYNNDGETRMKFSDDFRTLFLINDTDKMAITLYRQQ